MKKDIQKNKACLNCGTPLNSLFCPECGQKNKDYSLSFKDLFSDIIEDLLEVDSRVVKSLRMLFFKPGFLTREYVMGRRVSYLPPLRLYLVASVVFFLLISLQQMIPELSNNQFIRDWSATGDVEEALSNSFESMSGDIEGQESTTGTDDVVVFPKHDAGSGVDVTVGSKNMDLDQGEFLAAFSDNFAKVMFLLLPVAALQLKLLYLRRKKRYIEHLIFSLHLHAFIFSLLILTIFIPFKITMWLVILSSLAYLYLAMRRFYGQSHVKTSSKMLLLLLSYGLSIGIVMTLTMAATAISQVVT